MADVLLDVQSTPVTPSAGTGVAYFDATTKRWTSVDDAGNVVSYIGGPVSVATGGTGASTETNHGVLLGQGTSAIIATAVGATNTVLHGNTGADPTYSNIVNADIANTTIDLTAKVTGALPVANGGTSLATLTANNVILGNGTSAPAFVAPGANNNVLTSNGTTWTSAAASSGGSMALLKAGSGTSTAAGATTLDTVAISGLTSNDTIQIISTMESIVQVTAQVQVFSSTDNVALVYLSNNGNQSADQVWNGITFIKQAQNATTRILSGTQLVASQAAGYGNVVPIGAAADATVTTAWTGSWTLGLRHAGVTAGGTLRWKWAVYKVAGQ